MTEVMNVMNQCLKPFAFDTESKIDEPILGPIHGFSQSSPIIESVSSFMEQFQCNFLKSVILWTFWIAHIVPNVEGTSTYTCYTDDTYSFPVVNGPAENERLFVYVIAGQGGFQHDHDEFSALTTNVMAVPDSNTPSPSQGGPMGWGTEYQLSIFLSFSTQGFNDNRNGFFFSQTLQDIDHGEE